jgi:hypothetical protein
MSGSTSTQNSGELLWEAGWRKEFSPLRHRSQRDNARNITRDGLIGDAEPVSRASERSHGGKTAGLTPQGRRRLQEAALANRPWEHSMGPRTAEGKARSAANGLAGRPPAFPHLGQRGEFDSSAKILSVLAHTWTLAIFHRALLEQDGKDSRPMS